MFALIPPSGFFLFLGMLVGGIIIQDEVRLQFSRHCPLDIVEKGDEFLMSSRALHWAKTSPVAALRAAKRVVVP